MAYFGYFSPPYFLVFAGWPVSIGILFVPFAIILFGIAIIYVSLKNTPVSENKPTGLPLAQKTQVLPRRYCAWCGAELHEKYGFCEKCGKEASM